jgi:predicted HAD superfamily hydrolase
VTLTGRIAAFGCVSFDVFDTAVYRRVGAPEEVFARAAERCRAARRCAAFDFVAARRRAQAEAERRLGPAATLDDIYAALALPDGWRADELAAAEIAVEREVCAADPDVLAAFAAARAAGKLVVFASEMYLPAPAIAQILDDAGYRGYRALYVSSALGGLTKWSGDLFRHLAADLGVAPASLLHVGDDAWSDFWGAARAGVTPFHYRRSVKR